MSYFFSDMDKQALANSEVFSNYIKIQAKQLENEQKSQEKLAEENEALKQQLEKKIAEDINFKNKLIATKKYLIKNPEAVKSVDASFVKALNMLNLKDK